MTRSNKPGANAGAGPGKPGSVAPHSNLSEFYAEPAARAAFVNRLFDRSARYYDRISGLISFGTDRRYRKLALARAGLRPGMKMLDVATGTGLVVRGALDLGVAPKDITGLDPSRGMLQENARRHPVRLVQGKGEDLPFPDSSFDFIAMGYALRHVEDLTVLFTEFGRVLKPGGQVLILEITRPRSAAAFFAIRLYMQKLVPLFTRFLTGQKDVATLMEYYWATIAECVPPETILWALAGAGFQNVKRKQMHSVLSDYSAVKAVSFDSPEPGSQPEAVAPPVA